MSSRARTAAACLVVDQNAMSSAGTELIFPAAREPVDEFSAKLSVMARYITRITTDIGRDQAFSDLSHFDRAAEWDPGVAEGAMLTPEPVGRGSRFALRAGFLGRTVPLEYEIIEFEPGRRVVLRAETPFVRSIDTITFEPRAASSARPSSRTTLVSSRKARPGSPVRCWHSPSAASVTAPRAGSANACARKWLR